ncbi:hypothetical protein MANES_05G077100v8 [Manihot esculenta]|uniref:Chalcone isomerase domain-containing protein n=1 Tax=Manihot esculenta TaxID=3983 RepID=A0A2C9VU73_MANES|nr:hypothetical protein MANES_05G077100v8 [Manihot esculenta]
MVSLRFPFLFSQPKRPCTISNATTSRSFSAATVVACSFAAGAAAFSGIAAAQKITNPKRSFLQNALDFLLPNHSSLPWGSLSLADTSSTVVESKTGVYADNDEVKKVLGQKYGKLSISELKENEGFKEDLMEGDICMTVRLQIVYSKLSIRSVRSAFEESVGSRLQKFGGPDNKELLRRFASQFKDEYKIPKGSVIELSKDRGHVLRTRIDGKEVGSIQSKLLCRSILDLYMGEDPFDRQAKEEIESKLASFLQQ